MKIAVKDLRPNPFRNVGRYPINQDKVESLKTSIRDTSFWDNLIVRKAPDGDGYELAYGHHREQALRELKIAEIDVPVRKLSDTEMARIMAHENMAEWSHSTAIEQETVRTVIEGYAAGRIELPKVKKSVGRIDVRHAPSFQVSTKAKMESSSDDLAYDAESLTAFLGWKLYKVRATLAALALIEEGLASDKLFNGLSTKQAEIVASEVRRVARETDKPELARAVGKRLATGMKQAINGHDRAGHERKIKDVTIHNARHRANEMIGKQRKPTKKMPPINAFASDLVIALSSVFPTQRMQEKLDAIIEYRDELGADERRRLVGALRALAKRADRFAHDVEG